MAYGKLAAIGQVLELNANAHWTNNTTGQTDYTDCYIMTENNIIMYCANLVVTGSYTSQNTNLFRMPTALRPVVTDILPIVVRNDSNNTYEIKMIRFLNTGYVGLLSPNYSNGCTIFLSGLCHHINSRYYRAALGNIYNNGTSPLTAR